MADQEPPAGAGLRPPRAAAVAGIVFSLLLGPALVARPIWKRAGWSPSVKGSAGSPHRLLVLRETAGSSSIAFEPSTFPESGKPVTSQVTTTPGHTRRRATRSDTDIYLACSNPT